MVHVVGRAGNAVAAPWMSPSERQQIPCEIADAVELWARQWGRHGTIGMNQALRCPVIELSLKSDDPRLKHWQEGRLKYEPKESILLHYQRTEPDGSKSVHFYPLNLEELGVSGVLEILDRGNMWSGRGEYENFQKAAQVMGEYNEKLKQQMKDAAVEEGRLRARDMRRQVLGLPLVSVPDNIGARSNGNT